MGLLESFYPDERISSAYEIDYEKLYDEGYRGVIFDIDNTLVMHGYPATEQAIELFSRLNNIGFKALTLSNNKEPRVKSFAEKVGCDYIYKADKPLKKGYLNAMIKMNTNKDNTLFVGDQLFTDVWGAKRLGIRNILVNPINPKEEIQIIIKRRLEAIVLYFYEKNKAKLYRDKTRK